MKNKILASITALCAALVLVGGFSVTAYAQTPTEETDDSGVIVETEPQPLTPEGNMTLVDDIDGDAAEDKQFIVVKSKGGNYFYIIVDRAAEGENSVHFLNQVDESDLMAIIGEEQTEQPPAVCNCTEKCKAGEVNTACPVCSAAMNNCTGKEAEPEAPAEPEKPKNSMGGLLIFLVVGLLGGAARDKKSRTFSSNSKKKSHFADFLTEQTLDFVLHRFFCSLAEMHTDDIGGLANLLSDSRASGGVGCGIVHSKSSCKCKSAR